MEAASSGMGACGGFKKALPPRVYVAIAGSLGSALNVGHIGDFLWPQGSLSMVASASWTADGREASSMCS